MNRSQRRMAQSFHKKEVKKAISSNEWTSFEDRTSEARSKFTTPSFKGFYVNNIFSIQVFNVGEKTVAGIRRHDQSTNVSWATKQRIKNEIFGREIEAVEVFPKESLLVDQAEMYWIWICDCSDFNLNNLKVSQ